MLKTHLLIRNHEDTIEQSLKSLLPLEGEIVVGDLGCGDGTVSICKKYGVRVVRIGEVDDYSTARNQLSGEEWNFYLNPWEVLAAGHEQIKQVSSGDAYYVQVFSANVVHSEIRLWQKLKFINPVFEHIPSETAPHLDGVIVYSPKPVEDPTQSDRLAQWKRSGSLESYYYDAYFLLSNRKYKEFIETAKYYLSVDDSSKSSVMLRYYMSQIQLYIRGESAQAAKDILPCVAARPMMAEFWCVLADVYYKRRKYTKAKSLYENAIILGSRRSKNDTWPLEIDKYGPYPEKMIRSCDEMEGNVNLFRIDLDK